MTKEKQKESHFEAKKLSVLDWLKYLALTAIIGLVWAWLTKVSIVLALSVIVLAFP